MERLTLRKEPRKILIIKPSSLGDIVHSLPFLHVMNRCFPDTRIDWIVARGNEGLLEGNPLVSKLWIIDKDSWKSAARIKETILEMVRLARSLRAEKYDIVIDLQGLLRSGLMAMASGACVRVGFREAREGSVIFYTHKIEGGSGIHAVDRYLRVAHALGCDTRDVSFPMPVVQESERISGLKKRLGEYAVIVPGARWQTKRWLADSFGSVAAMLKVRSVIVGSEADRAIANKIADRSKGMAVTMAGDTSMAELISLIRGASYVITNDSGPMHIAAAYGVPAVAIFGPTNPAMTGPYGHNHIIVTSGSECAPCYRKKCDDLKCMKEISVEQVQKAIMKALGSKQAEESGQKKETVKDKNKTDVKKTHAAATKPAQKTKSKTESKSKAKTASLKRAKK